MKNLLADIASGSKNDNQVKPTKEEYKAPEVNIDSGLQHISKAIGSLDTIYKSLKTHSTSEEMKKNMQMQLDLLDIKKHLVNATQQLQLQWIQQEQSQILTSSAGKSLKVADSKDGQHVNEVSTGSKISSLPTEDSQFKSDIKGSRRRRAGSDAQFDNTEYQARIEDNMLNVFEKMIKDKQGEDKTA